MEGQSHEQVGDLASALQMAAAAAMNGPMSPVDSLGTVTQDERKAVDVMESSRFYLDSGSQAGGLERHGGEGGFPDVVDAFKRIGMTTAGSSTEGSYGRNSSLGYGRGGRMSTPLPSGHWQSPNSRQLSARGSIDGPRIEVVRPSQQDPFTMERMAYEHTGPPTIIRDADGQEYLVQPVRESLDMDRNLPVGSYQRPSFGSLPRPGLPRRSIDELYSPFGGPSEEKTAPLFGGGQEIDPTKNAVRDPSVELSGESAGKVSTMYFESLRHSCPVSVEVRSGLLHPNGSISRSGSLAEEAAPHDRETDEWEVQLSDLTFGPRIGRGAYGEVFRGYYRETEVAIKVFLEQDVSEKVLQAFKKEVAILKKLRHPNILQFMGACTQPQHLCIISEYEPNGSLFKFLHRSNIPMTQEAKVRVALDTAIGMNYLHTSTPPIIHGDLKSANLLLNHDFHVKVCDFGLSRVKLSAKLSVGSKLGTPEWTAPEVLKHSESNEASDVYSFGVVLWEIFTRKIPWEDVNPMQVIILVGFHDERLPIPTDIPEWASELIRDCFKSAEERPLFRDITGRLRHVLKSLRKKTDNGE